MGNEKTIKVTKSQLRRLIREALSDKMSIKRGYGKEFSPDQYNMYKHKIYRVNVPKHLSKYLEFSNDPEEVKRMANFSKKDWDRWHKEKAEEEESVNRMPMYNGVPVKEGDTFIRKAMRPFQRDTEDEEQLDLYTVIKIDDKRKMVYYENYEIGPEKYGGRAKFDRYKASFMEFLHDLKLDNAELVSPREAGAKKKLVKKMLAAQVKADRRIYGR